MKLQIVQMKWGRIVAAVILIVFFTLTLNLIADLLVFHIWSRPDQQPFAGQITFWIPSILSILLTFAGAAWVVRKAEREPQLHGFLVGLVVALILFLLSSGFQGEFVLVTVVTTILTIVAGWLGGVIYLVAVHRASEI